jgi:hypothetical protein
MDPTSDLMLSPNEADPQQLLQDLLAISQAPQAAKTGATASTFPPRRVLAPTPMPTPKAGPMAPPVGPPSMPSSGDPSADGGGTDWRGILRLIAPAIGSLVAGGGHQMPAFWSAYQGRQTEMDQERQRQQLALDNKRKAAAEFLLQTEHDAEGYDDPVLLAQHLSAADEAGALAGFTKPGDLKNKYTVSPNKLAQKKLDELNTLLDNAEKGGYNLDDLATSGAVLTTKDGGHVPVATAIDLTRKRPLDAQGQPVSKPAKAASTEEERFLDKFAKDNGYKSAADLPSSLELQGRKLFRDAGRPSEKIVAPGGVDAQFNDLVESWKTLHPGKEPPADVRLKLRKQANEVNDNPRGLGGMNSLYGQSDPKTIGDAIIRGDLPPNTERLGRPVGAAVESYLASQGYNVSRAVTDWKATQRHISTLNGPQQLRLNQSINALPDLLDSVDGLAAKWKAGRFPILNKANLALAKGGVYGPQAATIANQLDSQIADVVADLGNVYMGGNSPTDHALALASKSLSADWDERVLHDMVALAKSNVGIRRNSIQSTGVAGASPDNPYLPTPAAPRTPAVTAPSAAPVSYADYLKAKKGGQ